MARFVVRSARSGLDHFNERKPHEALAFFMALGLITNTRAISHALIFRDAKRSPQHSAVIAEWKRCSIPTLARFEALIIAARDLFIKEFSATPLVVRVTSNGKLSSYEVPIYIPITRDIEMVLTKEEQEWRSALAKPGQQLSMRINLLPECAAALDVWDTELDKIELNIKERLGVLN